MWATIRPAWWVMKRELRDQLRDWRITIPIMGLTLVFPFVMNFSANRLVGFVEQYGATVLSERLIPFFLLVVGFFPISVSLVIALESFVGEKERGSIEPLLSSPLDDWHMYVGKLMAVMVTPLIGSYLGIGIYLFGAFRKWGWTPESNLLIMILTITLVQAFVMVSGAVVISTQTTTVRAANLLASFIVIPIAFLIQGETVVMFWGTYQTLWWVVFGLIVIAILLTRTGISHFNREELLGREMDVLNLKWMWRVFKTRFIGKSTSIRTWFTIELRETLGSMRISMGLMVLILAAAGYIGVYLSEEFAIPPGIINLDQADPEFFDQLDMTSLISANAVFFIWLHNIRAIVIGTFLGIFSFGILGLLSLMTPIVLIAYFMVPAAVAGLPPLEFLLALVLPHGIFEIPAMLLSGAVVLKIGAGMAAPNKGESVGEGLLRSLADWAKIFIGVIIPLLFFSAVMEALVTPRVAIWMLTQGLN